MNSHISPGLEKTRLADLEPRAIQSLYASMAREGYAHETRLAVHVTHKMALKQAVRWGLLNPAEMVDVPRDLGTRREEEEKARVSWFAKDAA